MSRSERRRLLAATSLVALGIIAPGGLERALAADAQSVIANRTPAAEPNCANAVGRDGACSNESIVVRAKRRNQTEVRLGGQLGALGDKDGLDVPFSIKSYSAALILNQQPQTLGQVLENDPSVRTTFGYGNFSEIFVIRGLPVYSDDVAVDGLYGVAPRQLVSPELFDQVQVLDGANAFLNGAAPGGSSIGGGVNLLMKRADEEPLLRVTGTYASDSLGGGAVDMSRRFGRDKQFGVRINASGSSGDTTLDGEHRDSTTVAGAFDWRSDRAHLSLDVAYQDKGVRFGRSEVFLASGVQVPKVPSNTRNYGERWAYTRLKDVFGVVHGDYKLLPHLTAYADVGGRDGSENGDYTSLTVSNSTTGAGTAGFLRVPRTDDNESVRGGLRADLHTGPIQHTVDLGASGLWEVGRYAYASAGKSAANLFNPIYTASPTITSSAGNLSDPYPINRARLSSVYGSDTLSAFDNRVLLIVGVREQRIVVNSYTYATGALSSHYDTSKATPVVGLVVRPTRDTSLYFNRIEGLAQGPIAPATATNAGQVFPPYTSAQYEVGAKLERAHFAASLALFQIEQPSAYSQTTAGSSVPTYVVDGLQRNRGIEATVSGDLARGLRLIGGVTLNDPVLENTLNGATNGNKAIGVPDYTVNANLEYDLPFLRGGTVTGRVIQTGTQQVNTANSLQLPSWTRFDLGARYTFVAQKRPVTVRFGVDNVANERYWASSFGGYLLQGDARTYKFSLSVDL